MKRSNAVLLAGLLCSATNVNSSDFKKFSSAPEKQDVKLAQIASSLQSKLLTFEAQAPASSLILKYERQLANDPFRMVGAQFTDINKNPWQAALILGYAPEPIRQEFCGGSLIQKDWVLTAAHCVDNSTEPERVDVVLGTTYYRAEGERIKVSKIILHPNWNSATKENDIALLRLATPASMGSIIRTASVGLVIPPDSELLVSGWGAVLESGPTSDVLMSARIPLVENGICNAKKHMTARSSQR